MCFSKPSVPDPVPVQQPPTAQDPSVAASAQEAAKRNRAASGAASTMLTPGMRAAGAADESVPLLGKTALGQ